MNTQFPASTDKQLLDALGRYLASPWDMCAMARARNNIPCQIISFRCLLTTDHKRSTCSVAARKKYAQNAPALPCLGTVSIDAKIAVEHNNHGTMYVEICQSYASK
ncbi:hypothetical protein SK128_018285 [Halocaridina rubra]|uniref:Uncharacterized protein n=1 Tax=Halocaridina rubra TaxID=373956 RepID=A0AAN9A9A1_HALRR